MWPLPRGGRGGGCAHGGNMSSRPSAWLCPQPPTTVLTKVTAGEKYNALRGQKKDRDRNAAGSPEGSRAAGGSHGWSHGCQGPLLCTQLQADTVADTLDARTVKFLVQKSLSEKKKREEEKEKEKEKEDGACR